jgi:hypothetical protein
MAERETALANRNAEVEHLLVDQLEAKVPEIPARDLPGAVRNVATRGGIHTDKGRTYRGEPTEYKRHVSVAQSLRELQRLGAIDSTATEEKVQDAAVVDAEQLPERVTHE